MKKTGLRYDWNDINITHKVPPTTLLVKGESEFYAEEFVISTTIDIGDELEQPCGMMEITKFHVNKTVNDCESLYDLFDYTEEGLRASNAMKLWDLPEASSVYYISTIGVNPQYRQYHVGKSMVDAFLFNYIGMYDLAVLQPHPFMNVVGIWKGKEDWVSCGRSKEKGKKTLNRYWQSRGFERYKKTQYMFYAGELLVDAMLDKN